MMCILEESTRCVQTLSWLFTVGIIPPSAPKFSSLIAVKPVKLIRTEAVLEIVNLLTNVRKSGINAKERTGVSTMNSTLHPIDRIGML